MKLYHSPGSCSLCPHIVLNEAGARFELEKVDVRNKRLGDGSDFLVINPKGQVPVLELDDGETLTEIAAIVQYIADRYPEAGLVPANGSKERYRLQEWLSFIGAELHKMFPTLFVPKYPEGFRPFARQTLEGKLALLDRHLDDHDHLLGDRYSVADAYCYTILRWHKPSEMDLGPWPNIQGFMKRIEARPAVQEALREIA